jgi:hypothetical protein
MKKRFLKLIFLFLIVTLVFSNTLNALAQDSSVESESFSLTEIISELTSPAIIVSYIIDILIGILLSILFLYIDARTGKQLEEIITSLGTMRERRAQFVIMDLKNHFTTLLFTLGILNRDIIKYNKESEKSNKIKKEIDNSLVTLKHTIQVIRSTVALASDVLEPSVADEVMTICQRLEGFKVKEQDDQLIFNEYSSLKKRIFEITERLEAF